jgi:peptidoglycan-associated lipoprotein
VCDSGTCRLAPPPDPCRELGSVFFAPGSATLTEKSRATLSVDAACLASGRKRALVEGYADDAKRPELCVKLGLKRAEAVKKYLISLGVHPALLSTLSHGNARPACTETNEACGQRSRRVDLNFHK